MELKTALLISMILTIFMVSAAQANCRIFNFGDSNADTGAKCGLFGEIIGSKDVAVFPGHEITCKTSDGRLYIDFLCESLGLKTWTHYLEPVGADFSQGANFAFSGATILDPTGFHLNTQKYQFIHFRNRTLKLLPEGKGPQITAAEFEKAIFNMDIGLNDLGGVLSKTSEEVAEFVQRLIHDMELTVKVLYRYGGARKFVLHNTVPIGCLPYFRGVEMNKSKPLDGVGASMHTTKLLGNSMWVYMHYALNSAPN